MRNRGVKSPSFSTSLIYFRSFRTDFLFWSLGGRLSIVTRAFRCKQFRADIDVSAVHLDHGGLDRDGLGLANHGLGRDALRLQQGGMVGHSLHQPRGGVSYDARDALCQPQGRVSCDAKDALCDAGEQLQFAALPRALALWNRQHRHLHQETRPWRKTRRRPG